MGGGEVLRGIEGDRVSSCDELEGGDGLLAEL